MGSGSNEKEDEGKEKHQKWKFNIRYLSCQDLIHVKYQIINDR